jgi:ABC-2 type transport system ATP-binding protein
MTAHEENFVLRGSNLCKKFKRGKRDFIAALDHVSIEAQRGELTAIVGPDGAGKTTLLRLACGLMRADEGELTVLGLDASTKALAIQSSVSYMPQRFGLYEDLSVQENLDLYADLHGITEEQRRERYPRLMEMTALGSFRERLAGQLSGGMKQKLGLACTLVRSPALLLLDEPTVGVDPLSRRELWQILEQLVHDEGLSVIVTTCYMDEAEKSAHVLVMREGKAITHGEPADLRRLAEGRAWIARARENEPPRQIQAKLLAAPGIVDAVPHAGEIRVVLDRARGAPAIDGLDFESADPTLEDGLMTLLHEQAGKGVDPRLRGDDTRATTTIDRSEIVIDVHDVIRKFGDFIAVNRTSFQVHRGEVFGLLGPNGAGKTTTFRMLCGLLPASGGTLRVAGNDLRKARAEARQRIGYVAQKFSLYGHLNVLENLEFFGGTYGLKNHRLQERIRRAMRQFELEPFAELTAAEMPGGFQRRLAMAAALLHDPDILFLDEPTSGADPLARREFWRRITALADAGTTVVVTTHFMEEAEYCDRIMIQDAGRMLAIGTPDEVRHQANAEKTISMEEAFIEIVMKARDAAQRPEASAA